MCVWVKSYATDIDSIFGGYISNLQLTIVAVNEPYKGTSRQECKKFMIWNVDNTNVWRGESRLCKLDFEMSRWEKLRQLLAYEQTIGLIYLRVLREIASVIAFNGLVLPYQLFFLIWFIMFNWRVKNCHLPNFRKSILVMANTNSIFCVSLCTNTDDEKPRNWLTITIVLKGNKFLKKEEIWFFQVWFSEYGNSAMSFNVNMHYDGLVEVCFIVIYKWKLKLDGGRMM